MMESANPSIHPNARVPLIDNCIYGIPVDGNKAIRGIVVDGYYDPRHECFCYLVVSGPERELKVIPVKGSQVRIIEKSGVFAAQEEVQ